MDKIRRTRAGVKAIEDGEMDGLSLARVVSAFLGHLGGMARGRFPSRPGTSSPVPRCHHRSSVDRGPARLNHGREQHGSWWGEGNVAPWVQALGDLRSQNPGLH